MCTGCSPPSRIIKLIRISVLLHLSIGPQPHSGGSHAVAEVESIPTTVKADEVETIGTLIKLFSRVDLQAAKKAGRWMSRGTFTLFRLRPQADALHKVGPVETDGNIIQVTPTC